MGGTVVSVIFLNEKEELLYADKMHEAADLTKKWFLIIRDLKTENGVLSDSGSEVPYKFMIGNEWSEITSSLGSLEAKETSTNPDFAALIVRLLIEAGIDNQSKAGIILSGSFPSLAISAFAALQTLGIDALVMSSLGSSTYGANQAELTWIDMEHMLVKKGDLNYSSSLVSIGAGHDNGFGLSEKGIMLIHRAAERNRVNLYIPATLQESIELKVDLFLKEGIDVLINIGGNESAIGACPHALSIPNGFSRDIVRCSHKDRGVVLRMNEHGVPIINMLNIKDLASRYGIEVAPGIDYSESSNLYTADQPRRLYMFIFLLAGLIPLLSLKKSR
jgi:poly-gamma-glutamate system protein